MCITCDAPGSISTRCQAHIFVPRFSGFTASDSPLTNALAAGAVIDPVGAVLSTRTLVTAAEFVALPMLSVL